MHHHPTPLAAVPLKELPGQQFVADPASNNRIERLVHQAVTFRNPFRRVVVFAKTFRWRIIIPPAYMAIRMAAFHWSRWATDLRTICIEFPVGVVVAVAESLFLTGRLVR